VSEQRRTWLGAVLGAEPLESGALDAAYERAVCRGADLTGRRAEDERLDGPLALLAEITIHTPDLRLFVAALNIDDGLAREAADAVRRHSAGLVRLAHRALEVHARDVGYSLDAWREQALVCANWLLCADDEHDGLPPALRELDTASRRLAAAIAAVPVDSMAVPDHLASAQGAWLSCYLRATRRLGL
jgi:hypothetical protein